MSKAARASSKENDNDAVSAAKLLDLRLAESNWTFDLSQLQRLDELQKFTHQSIADEPYFSPENGQLIGKVLCFLVIATDSSVLESEGGLEDAASQAAIICQANYIVAFDVPKNFSIGDARAFFESTAKFAVWPYFRSHVATLAAQSRLELPPLPLTTLVQRVKPSPL